MLMHLFFILLTNSRKEGVHFMYTGAFEVRVPGKPRRKNRGARLVVLMNILMIAVCLAVLGKTVRAAQDTQEVTALEAPVEQAEAQPQPQTHSAAPADTLPPQILGVQDLTVYEGDAIAFRTGITVTDDTDPAPTLEVDAFAVDLTIPGVYTVFYIASDCFGNVAWQRAAVTVLRKSAGFVELSEISRATQEILSVINWPAASPREQVDAIYSWVRSNLQYGGHSDRTDWRQTAYSALQSHRGDCFGYFAVSKLLFEALGIPNIDVVKVQNGPSDSEHYWSLVSVDGGRSYYHFDATPRMGEGDNFCLVTDDFLDAYSRNNKGSHSRDTSLYPATPKEALR